MIQVIGTSPQVEIQDIDGIYLLNLIIFLAQDDMFRNGFRHSIQDAFQVIELACQLNLHDDDFIPAVLCLDIHTVELIVGIILIALAFQEFNNMNTFIQENGHKTFKHPEISLLPKDALGGPVETNNPVILH